MVMVRLSVSIADKVLKSPAPNMFTPTRSTEVRYIFNSLHDAKLKMLLLSLLPVMDSRPLASVVNFSFSISSARPTMRALDVLP